MNELIAASRQALEALESYHGYMEPLTTVFGGPRVPAEQSTTGKVEKAITALRTAIEAAEKQQALDKMAENARELGLDYEPVQERNFCERCGKRLGNEWLIHTCTPPAAPVQKLTQMNGKQPPAPWNTPAAQRHDTPAKAVEWVGLTDEEIYEMADDGVFLGNVKEIARAIEAKLREKNGGAV